MAQPYTCEKLIKACYMGDFEKVKELATRENVNKINEFGYTPIQTTMLGMKNICKSERYILTAMVLMDFGANPFTTNHSNVKTAAFLFPQAKNTLEKYFIRIRIKNEPYITTENEWKLVIAKKEELKMNDKGLLKKFKNSDEFVNYWTRHNNNSKQR